jgi:drug/metabolite transporter (DMT)-like permease
VSGERRGWNRGWDVKGAAIGLFLIGAGIVLVRRDDAAFDALPALAIVGAVACVVLAVALARIEGAVGDAASKELTRRRARRSGATRV